MQFTGSDGPTEEKHVMRAENRKQQTKWPEFTDGKEKKRRKKKIVVCTTYFHSLRATWRHSDHVSCWSHITSWAFIIWYIIKQQHIIKQRQLVHALGWEHTWNLCEPLFLPSCCFIVKPQMLTHNQFRLLSQMRFDRKTARKDTSKLIVKCSMHTSTEHQQMMRWDAVIVQNWLAIDGYNSYMKRFLSVLP